MHASALYCPRLMLLPTREEHAQHFYEPFCDKDLYVYIKDNPPSDLKWLEDTFRKVSAGSGRDDQVWLSWTSWTREHDPVGYLTATVEGPDCYLAYYTFREHQGQGKAREGIEAIMKYMATFPSIKTFVIEMDTRNRASGKLAESLGFRWTKTTNQVALIKGHQSHEFRFEKSVLG